MQTLIVDDEEDMRFLLRTTIQIANQGLEVAGEAADGFEALRRWREDRPDCVVIDHRMPGVTGLDVCREILTEDPHQSIVLFSAHLDDELRRAASALGVRACLSKVDIHLLPETLWGIAAA